MRGTRTFLMLSMLGLVPALVMSSSHPDWGPEPPVAPFTQARLPHEWALVNMIFPLIGPCDWSNDYDVPRGRYRHTGIDIKAPMMTPIVAPFSGTLGMKRESFWIYGDNRWAMLGTHLNDADLGTRDHDGDRDVMFAPDLQPGQHVEAGQFIGYVGMSGNATGPHLHFELYAPGNGPSMSRIRNPIPSLKMAQVLKQAKIVLPQSLERPSKNQFRFQGCIRKVDEKTGKVTIIVLARQDPTGEVVPFKHVRYMRLKLSENALAEAGGWTTLNHMPESKTLAFYVPMTPRPDDTTVSRVLMSPEGMVGRR